MILSKTEIIAKHNALERERRVSAKAGTVESLSDMQIADRLDGYISASVLRAERKRRRDRLYYLRVMANPKRRSVYKARKKAERAARRDNANSSKASCS